MALHVEYLHEVPPYGPLYSVAHYYEHNGDMMRDPDMEFLKSHDGYFSHQQVVRLRYFEDRQLLVEIRMMR